MTKQLEIYKCEICGNMVEVLFAGAGELSCCGEPMKLQEEQTSQKDGEGHIPIFEKEGENLKVKVGKIEHPMTQEHFIEMIEIVDSDKLLRKYLFPDQKPEFDVKLSQDWKYAREYCNLHGLWKGENNDF